MAEHALCCRLVIAMVMMAAMAAATPGPGGGGEGIGRIGFKEELEAASSQKSSELLQRDCSYPNGTVVHLSYKAEVKDDVAPEGWTCSPALYNGSNGCDCACGLYDPDCTTQPIPFCNCNQHSAERCTGKGTCYVTDLASIAPPEWTCDVAYYLAEDGCDCMCNATDPDCQNVYILSSHPPEEKLPLSQTTFNCLKTEFCNVDGICVDRSEIPLPPAWTAAPFLPVPPAPSPPLPPLPSASSQQKSGGNNTSSGAIVWIVCSALSVAAATMVIARRKAIHRKLWSPLTRGRYKKWNSNGEIEVEGTELLRSYQTLIHDDDAGTGKADSVKHRGSPAHASQLTPNPQDPAAAKSFGDKEAQMTRSPAPPLGLALPRSPNVSIPEDQIQVQELVGKGSLGAVFRGTWNMAVIAVKKIPISNMGKEEMIQLENSYKREIALLVKLRHPHILSYYGLCWMDSQLGIVMEFMARGSLHSLLHEHDYPLARLQRLRLCVEIASGVQYLHQNGIVHRNIRTQSILLCDRLSAKVSDFGREHTAAALRSEEDSARPGIQESAAPEVLDGSQYGFSADVWSYGVVVCELMTGRKPFAACETKDELYTTVVVERQVPDLSPVQDEIDRELVPIVRECCCFEARKRPPMNTVLININEVLHKFQPTSLDEAAR